MKNKKARAERSDVNDGATKRRARAIVYEFMGADLLLSHVADSKEVRIILVPQQPQQQS